jgi:2-polyprenyl-3-methyl-5-hydroxy-6-metoxy-1,4-benzoquinol methylase
MGKIWAERSILWGSQSREFRRDTLNNTTISDFFDSGQEHIAFVLKTIRACIYAEFSPARALDFGCGVGRCIIPLAEVCEAVVGVDISESMLGEAKQNCAAHAITNVELVKADDALSKVSGTFDLIHCVLVFQHIPCQRGERIFTHLVERLANNGVAVIQFVYHRDASSFIRLMNLLRKYLPLLHNLTNLFYHKSFSEPLMEKNIYDLNRIFKILDENGCGNVHIRFLGGRELQSIILFFQKKRDEIPPHMYMI